MPISVDLAVDKQPFRLLYGLPRLVDWLSMELPEMETSINADTTPLEQVDALLNSYISGSHLGYGRQFHELRPSSNGVWELKTPDTRIFGWFVAADQFIATAGADATTVKRNRLYSEYRDAAVEARLSFGLPFVTGKSPDDVLSFFN